MHLDIAEQIRRQAVQNGHGRLADQLGAEWPAFYLGSVAPDINAISDIRRAETHFYDIPPRPENEAVPEMLAQYPLLAAVDRLPAAQAIFVAAYSAHLLLDLIWLREIVVPFFFQADHLGPPAQRRLTHFILLTYLDTISLEALPDTAVTTLAQASPNQWLPFVPDALLVQWRDMLVDQLHPEAPVRTVEIYAGRLGMSAAEFGAALHDPAWMEEHVFSKLPVLEIQAIIQTAVPRSVQLITDYLQADDEGRIGN